MADLAESVRGLLTGFHSVEEWETVLARVANLEQAALDAAGYIGRGDFGFLSGQTTPADARRLLANRLLEACGEEPMPDPVAAALTGGKQDGTEPNSEGTG